MAKAASADADDRRWQRRSKNRPRPATAAPLWLFFATWLSACAAAVPLAPADSGPRAHAVSVVSNGWHTAIVIERGDLISMGLLPEAEDFPNAAFLEFGWGDRVYYPAREKTFGMTLDAALTVTPAVMHMAGLARPPERTYADAEVVPVALSQSGFRRLASTIADYFERPEGRRAAPVSRGLYPNSNFYNARGAFHLFNTCNTWTARMLRAGGVDLSPSGVVSADELMARLRAAVNPRQLPNDQNGDVGVFDDLVRDAAQKQALQFAQPPAAHDDQVGTGRLYGVKDHAGRVAFAGIH
jgi:uncharacterized protein (TIGR02117 family)